MLSYKLNRRQYIKLGVSGITATILSACTKDTGALLLQKHLSLTGNYPMKVYSGESYRLTWEAKNILWLSLYLKHGINDWQLFSSDIEAAIGSYDFLLPSKFTSTSLSLKLVGDGKEVKLTNLFAQNAVKINLNNYPDLNTIGGIAAIQINQETAFLKRTTINTVVCFNGACTHAGCPISYLKSQNKFNCPCHGSQFDINGDVLQGPASSALSQYTCEEIMDNNVRILF
jgi:Rieske Fe-S protein